VISREETQAGHAGIVVLQSYGYVGRFGFIMQNSANNYGSATATEIAEGAYIVDSTLTFADGTGPYEIF
jgi:predicted N-acetyltransferase YhbS